MVDWPGRTRKVTAWSPDRNQAVAFLLPQGLWVNRKVGELMSVGAAAVLCFLAVGVLVTAGIVRQRGLERLAAEMEQSLRRVREAEQDSHRRLLHRIEQEEQVCRCRIEQEEEASRRRIQQEEEATRRRIEQAQAHCRSVLLEVEGIRANYQPLQRKLADALAEVEAALPMILAFVKRTRPAESDLLAQAYLINDGLIKLKMGLGAVQELVTRGAVPPSRYDDNAGFMEGAPWGPYLRDSWGR
jgi:hypothetical protein